MNAENEEQKPRQKPGSETNVYDTEMNHRQSSVKTEEEIARAGLIKAAAQAKAECDLLGKPYTPQLHALLSYLRKLQKRVYE